MIVGMCLLLSTGRGAAVGDKGGQGGAFLRMPVGARQAGMGNAFVGVADDASVLYYNPGGLYQADGSVFGATYSLMSMDRTFYNGSLVHSFDEFGTFSLMFTRFGVSDIDGRDEVGNPTGSFDDSELALRAGYGKELILHLGAGGAIKYLNHSLKDNKATGIGFDAGAHVTVPVENSPIRSVRFGFAVVDLMSTLSWDTSSSREDEIPSTIRVGTGIDFVFRDIGFLVAVDVSRTMGESLVFRGGGEAWLYGKIALRAGVDGDNLHFGISVKRDRLRLDYAISADELEDGATNKLGVQVEL